MIKNVAEIILTSLLGKFFGFLKIILLINFFGTNYITDALIVVISIYWFWSKIVVYSLFSVSLIPSLSKVIQSRRQLSITLRTLQSVNIISIVGLILVLLFPSQIITIFAPADNQNFTRISVKLIYLMSPLILLIPLTEIFTILNQYKKRMIIASINLTIWNILQLLALVYTFYFLEETNYLIYYFSGFTVLGYLITSILQIKTTRYFDFFNSSKLFNISFSNLILITKKNYKFFFATLFSQLNLYIDNYFISYLDSGFITKYNIIIKVPELIQSLLISAVSVVFFNKIVEKNVSENKIYLKYIFYLIPFIFFLIMLATFFGSDFLYLIYKRSAFDGLSNSRITSILNIIILNVFFMISVSLLMKIYISKNSSKIILNSSIINVLINITANYLLITNYGIYGIAISTFISTYILNWILSSNYFKFNVLKNILIAGILVLVLIILY